MYVLGFSANMTTVCAFCYRGEVYTIKKEALMMDEDYTLKLHFSFSLSHYILFHKVSYVQCTS